MKTENSQQEVISLIKKCFNSDNINKINKTKEALIKDNKITIEQFTEYQLGKSLNDVDIVELCILFDYFSRQFEISKIEDYFTDIEVRRANLFEIEKEDNNTTKVFENVEKLSENQYGFYLPVYEIAKYKNDRTFEIDPELQREMDGKKNVYKIKVNNDRTEEIKELIKLGKYKYNSIRVNLMDDENSYLDYNESTRKLIIKGKMIIPDGNHRATACVKADMEMPNIEDKFHIIFTYFGDKEVQETISQEWNVEPVKKSHKETMKQNNANDIIKIIKRNEYAEPLYKDRIVTDGNSIFRNKGFIQFNILSKAIEDNYDTEAFKMQSDKQKLANWLVEFFNELSELMQDDFSNFANVKKTKWSVHPAAWVGYVYLSKQLQSKDNWQETLKEIISSIDFDNSNSPLINKTVKNELLSVRKYFEKVVENHE